MAETEGTLSEAEERSKAMVVLGMHRSGTSLVSGCLRLAGVDFGEGLMRPDDFNPKGYWEQNDIVVLHDRLLNSFEMSWDSVGALPADWLDHPATLQAEAQIADILKANFANSSLWAIKDPRLCRFLPLWERILNKLCIDPVFVHVVRDPQESALSLQKRNQFSLERGRALWATYNFDISRALTKEKKQLSVLFEDFLQDPVSNVEKILRGAGCDQALTQKSRREIEIFCDSSLRHHRVEKAKPAKADKADLLYEVITKNGALGRSSEVVSFWLGYASEIERTLHRKEGDYAVATKVLDNSGRHVVAQIFVPDENGNHSEAMSQRLFLPSGTWHQVSFDVDGSSAIAKYGLRLDPCNEPGEVKISSWSIRRRDTDKLLAEHSTWDNITVSGPCVRVEVKGQSLTLISYGTDPQIFFPPQEIAEAAPLTVQFWILYDRSMPSIQSQLNRVPQLEPDHTEYELKEEELQRVAKLNEELEKRVKEYESEEEGLTEDLQEIITCYDDLKVKAARLSVAEAIIQREAAKAFRRQCLRPVSPLRKFTSHKIPWLHRILPRASLRIDQLSLAYSTKEAPEALNQILQNRDFDASYYLETYPEIKDYEDSSFYHYLKYGWKEGRNPSRQFDVREYLKKRPDVEAAGVEPLTYYLKHERAEKAASS